MENRDTLTVFALGGLGGGNSFGAGVLTALDDLDIYPDVITCTSGMVAWTALFLAGQNLPEVLKAAEKGMNFEGVPAAFKPAAASALYFQSNQKAIQSYFQRWMTPLNSPDKIADALMPVRVLDPFLSAEELEFYAHALSSSSVGVIFNAFEPATGTEILYVNAAARERVPLANIDGRRIEPITAQGVENALWLSHFGYTRPDGSPQMAIDGAYRRQFILQEVMDATRLFVARPEHRKYLGRMPRNQIEQKVFETYMWMSAAYRSELQTIQIANTWAAEGRLTGKRHTDIVEIQNEIPMTFDKYFTETSEMLERARATTVSLFNDAWLDPKILLRKLSFLDGLSTDILQRLSNNLAPVSVHAGQAVVEQGEAGDAMYFVIKGKLHVETAGGVDLTPGTFFGEMALLDAAPRNATVRAVSDCKLFRLSRRDFLYLCEAEPEFEAHIRQIADTRAA